METKITVDIPFNLDFTLDCGQTFRWNKLEDGSWLGIVDRTLLILKQQGNELHITSPEEKLFGMNLKDGVRYYLGFEDDLDFIRNNIIANLESCGYREQGILMNKIFGLLNGLRILRQDPWEMLIEYLISARNNIPAIKRTIEKLCELFPENKRKFNNIGYHTFPNCEQIKTLTIEKLEGIKLAFRAKWIFDTVRTVDLKKLYSLKEKSFQEKLEYLLSLRGVGYKIANCVMLFSMEELSAFPVDVWINRIMKKLFNVEGGTKKVMELGKEYFGSFAGYAQEYLFRYFRNLERGTMNDR